MTTPSYGQTAHQTDAYAPKTYGASSYDATGSVSQMTWIQRRKVDWQLADTKTKVKFWLIVALVILILILVILFEAFKKDFVRWVQPLTSWLQERKAWSWLIPVGILIVLSIPPLAGHEVVALVVGLVYPLGVAIAIVCLGTLLGEALCFVAFKYGFRDWVDRRRERSDQWEATGRVCEQGSWRLILLIRYSIMPGHITNPLFATVGISFWVYMITIVLGLPKQLVLTALGYPNLNSGHQGGVRAAKVIAFAVLIVVSIIATWIVRKRYNARLHEVAAERGHESPSAKYQGTYVSRARAMQSKA